MIAIQPPLINIGLSKATWNALVPLARIRSWDWICKYFRTEDGAAFNSNMYPWAEGICDAYDQRHVREIWMQFAARAGKTTIATALMQCSIANNPSPALFASATKEAAQRTVTTKLIPQLRNNEKLRKWLPDSNKMIRQALISLKHCNWYIAWSGSETQLADICARFKHAGEIDKWDSSASKEADSLELFKERGAELFDRKSIFECTPTITGISRVNLGLISGTNERWNVPCPHCGKFQQLRLGTGDIENGGMIWDKTELGKSNPVLARETARYMCSCGGEIFDEDRRWMNRRGQWVPEGQFVGEGGTLHGETKGDPTIRTFQLGRIYSPTCTLGEYAAAFVSAVKDKVKMRSFVNSWEGLTWDLKALDITWQEASERLTGAHESDICPYDSVFVCCGVDVQLDHLVYLFAAFGPEKRMWGIRYGTCRGWDELLDHINTTFPHADGGKALPVGQTLIDSRYRTSEVIDFCVSNSKRLRRIWPEEGIQRSGARMYRDENILPGRQKQVHGIRCIKVSREFTQTWLHSCLEHRRSGDVDFFQAPLEARDDEDFWLQVINVGPVFDDKKKLKWDQLDHNIPVDFRDAIRYCRAAAEVYVLGRWNRMPKRAHLGESAPTPSSGGESVQVLDPGENATPVAEKKPRRQSSFRPRRKIRRR